MQPSSVDFPAPFGPIRHVSEPRSMRRVTSSTAATAPKDLPTPCDLAGVRRTPPPSLQCSRTGRLLSLFVNAVPNRGVGLHEAILPAHMLGSWIPLWFVRREVEPAAGRR